MAMIRVEPVEVQVRTDWFYGRPGRSRGATSTSSHPIAVVREEAAAYPVIAVHGRSSRSTRRSPPLAHLPPPIAPRWPVEGLDPKPSGRRRPA